MNLAVPEASLKQLRRYLQAQVETQDTPLQVQCAVKEGLMVLVQHPPGAAPNPQAVFAALEAALTHLPSELAEPLFRAVAEQRAKLFLRVLGQPKPYTFHSVMLAAAPAPADDLLTVIQTRTEAAAIAPPSQAAEDTPSANVFELPESFGTVTDELDAEATDEGGALVHQSGVADDGAIARSPQATLPQARPPAAGRSWLKPLLLVGSGLAAIVGVGLGGYALTRPCVIGGCPALETVAQLGTQAAQTVQTGEGATAPQQAQQVAEAQALVSGVPPWSGYYGQAQAVQQPLAQLQAAEAKAAEAIQKSQTTAQAVTDWQAVQSLWQEAIAQLQAIPPDHPFAAYAQARLAQFQANQKLAAQRITGETAARQRLLTAQKTAELAIARQNTAETLKDWQTAAATWQVAVNSLNQIPQEATTYAEAQQLVASYQPKLQASRDRATNEQAANAAQAQARKFAQQAQTWQQKNQWSQAIQAWRNALNQAKRIPANTSLTNNSQDLIASYSSALKQAEIVMGLRSELEQICNAAGRICTYTITNEIIRVEFIPAYERKVRTLGGLSYSAQDQNSIAQIDKHFATLSEALQTISNNSGLPVQVYNSDQELIGSFLPGLR